MVAPRRDSEERGIDRNKLFDIVRADLFTAVVGNVPDQMGHWHQFRPPEIRPLRAGTKMVGRAMPVLEADYPPVGRNGPLSDRAMGVT